jgi:hypothetical protein
MCVCVLCVCKNMRPGDEVQVEDIKVGGPKYAHVCVFVRMCGRVQISGERCQGGGP